ARGAAPARCPLGGPDHRHLPGGHADPGADARVRRQAVRRGRRLPADADVDDPVGRALHGRAVPQSAGARVMSPFAPGTLAMAGLLATRIGGALLIAPVFSAQPV